MRRFEPAVCDRANGRHHRARWCRRLTGAHPAIDGAFTLFDFPRPEPGIVSIPTVVEALYVEDADYFDQHALIFDAVQNLALDPQRSLDLIGSIAAEHDKRA